MKTIIKIYKIQCTKDFQMSEQHGPVFSLDGWGGNTDYYEGHDDGGTDYTLPDGFKVAESIGYGMQIYRLDPTGNECCELARHPNGRPQIWTRRHRNPVLNTTKAEAEAEAEAAEAAWLRRVANDARTARAVRARLRALA